MAGPLSGITIVELAGIGPGPFACMLLADLGADIIRIDRAGSVRDDAFGRPNLDAMSRGRRSIGVDLKHPDGVETVLQIVEHADALIEGFRPGVTERLGLGPDDCLARNPRLVYGRMTGWGQEGPMAHAAGHDINYISLAGALAHFGRAGERPVPPLNMVGDFGGGGMFMALGVVAAVLESRTSGKGQVIDVAMVDGTAVLMTFIWGMRNMGIWSEETGVNMLDTGHPYYDVYETADGKYISLGAIETQFYAEFLERVGLADAGLSAQMDRAGHADMRQRFTELFKSKTRAEWDDILLGTDACYAPVLTMSEAAQQEHMAARGTFIEVDGALQPAPAPRFSRTAPAVERGAPWPGEQTDSVLEGLGFDADRIRALRDSGAIK